MASFRDTRALADGAVTAGLTAVLGLLGMFIPPFLFLVNILMPIPLAVLVKRRGLYTALLSLAVTGLLLMMLYPSPLKVLLVFILFGPLGIVLGLLYKNHVAAGHALVAASVVSTVSYLTVIALTSLIAGVNLEMMQTAVNESMNMVFSMYQQAGTPIPADQQEIFRDAIKASLMLLPAYFIIHGILSANLSYLVGSKVLRRLDYKVNALPPFSQWRLPWYTIWGIILGLILFLGGSHFALNTVKITGQNILAVFLFIFFVIGLSVVAHYYKLIPFSKPFKILFLFLLILYIAFMYPAIMVLGVLDTVINLRRPLPKKES
ncbi:MAG: YybS family protein [Bacillota bacterium]